MSMRQSQHCVRKPWLAAIGSLLAVSVLSGCAIDDQRPQKATNLSSNPPSPAAMAAPAPDIQRVAYVANDGVPIPEPVAAPAPVPAAMGPGGTAGVPADDRGPVSGDLPGAETLTLEQAMAETLRSDPKLRGAMEAIRQARGDYVTSSLLPNPTVQVNGVFLPIRPFTATSPGGPPELDVIGTFPIDWYLFGKRAAAMTNAGIGVSVSHADYSDQVRQRLANTASAFYDVLEARAMVKLSREDLANLTRVAASTEEGVKNGGAAPIDSERIQLSVFDAQIDLRTRMATLATTRAQLRAAIGRTQAQNFDASGSLEVDKPAPPLSASEAIALAERNRPDIISLRRQIEKARSGVDVERTKARPSVSPSLGYQYQWQDYAGVADAPSYTAQMNVSLPIFDRNQGNIAKAQSVFAQSCYNLQAQLVQTEADVEQAVAEFQTAQSNAVTIGPQQLAKAKSVLDRTMDAYREGGKTLLDVLDAERAYRDTHRNYILAQSAYWHSLHKLNAAVGQQVLQ
jgi:outer membrane protein, heavy metal efflux system